MKRMTGLVIHPRLNVQDLSLDVGRSIDGISVDADTTLNLSCKTLFGLMQCSDGYMLVTKSLNGASSNEERQISKSGAVWFICISLTGRSGPD